MILLVGKSVGGLLLTDEQMDEVWAVSSDEVAGTVTLTLRAGPRPLVATLTEAEMTTVADLMPEVAAVTRRGEFSRIRLAATFCEAIGRDPFKQATVAPPQQESFKWWCSSDTSSSL